MNMVIVHGYIHMFMAKKINQNQHIPSRYAHILMLNPSHIFCVCVLSPNPVWWPFPLIGWLARLASGRWLKFIQIHMLWYIHLYCTCTFITRMHVCICIYCIYIYIYTHIHTHTCTYTLNIYIYYTYVCIYMYYSSMYVWYIYIHTYMHV